MVRPVLPVYLVHYDAPEWCESATRSIMASEGVDVRLAVIDNGSEGDPLDPDRLPRGVQVLKPGANVGYAGGVNYGLGHWLAEFPRASYCVVGSHDLHVAPDSLRELLAAAESTPRCGIAAPVILTPHLAAGGIWTGLRSMQVNDDIPRKSDGSIARSHLLDRDWASGTCLLLRRSCVEEIGFFDDDLGSYVEDVDFGLRARDHGWRVVVSTSAQVSSLGSASTRVVRYITRNTVVLSAKRRGLTGAFGTTALFALWIVKGIPASVAFWRPPSRRAKSASFARQRIQGLLDVRPGTLARAVRR